MPITFNPFNAAHRLIRDETPPTPACFDSREAWRAYLLKAVEGGARIVRREDTGKWRGDRHTRHVLVSPITRHCEDCLIGGELQTRMVLEGRCYPVIDIHRPPTESMVMPTTKKPTTETQPADAGAAQPTNGTRFKSPDPEAPIHLALTTGHTFVVGADPVEVPPRFLSLAIARGAIAEGGAQIGMDQRLRAAWEMENPNGFARKEVIELMTNRVNSADFDRAHFPGAAEVALATFSVGA